MSFVLYSGGSNFPIVFSNDVIAQVSERHLLDAFYLKNKTGQRNPLIVSCRMVQEKCEISIKLLKAWFPYSCNDCKHRQSRLLTLSQTILIHLNASITTLQASLAL